MNPEQPLSSCFVAGFSMEPLLHSGDRVILRPVEHHAVVPGDLIVFFSGRTAHCSPGNPHREWDPDAGRCQSDAR